MQYTRNYNLKKPDYTDFADIKDINDNIDKIDEELAAPTGDTADSTATFTCSDVADGDAAAWTNVPALTSGETHKSIFAKMSQMFKNLRYLYKLLGTKDISSIGDGTVTGGLSSLNDSLARSYTTDVYGNGVIERSGRIRILQYSNDNFNSSGTRLDASDRPKIEKGVWATFTSGSDFSHNYRLCVSLNGEVSLQRDGVNFSGTINLRGQIMWIV